MIEKKLKGFDLSNQIVKCFDVNPKQQLNISSNLSRSEVFSKWNGKNIKTFLLLASKRGG